MPAAVQVRDLHYTYPAPAPNLPAAEVLRGVSFDVYRGEFVALLGRIGAGKSTLCLALNGLVPHATGGVFRGQVLVEGKDTRRHTVADLARNAGLVFQDPETQLTQMRVEDEVTFGPENLGLPRAEIQARLEQSLAAVGLATFRDRSPSLLSGGEKQRVTIASTLAMRPAVLVLDEPTSNLDPEGKAAVFAVLTRLAHEQEMAVIIATQDVERAARYADRCLVLEDGRIAADAPPAQALADAGATIGQPSAAEIAVRLTERTGRYYRFETLGAAYTALRRLPRKPAAPRAEAGSAAQEPVVRFEGVSYAYPDETPALSGVNFTLDRGEFVALTGRNGSGKTTLAKHINGLLKPLAGRVLVDGVDTRDSRVALLARRAGYVFQNPDHQIFAPTVREEIAFSLRVQGLPPSEVAQRTGAVLREHRLEAFADLPPALLASGQRRQVALAAVLATQPQVLIMDEPTGGLDRASRAEMMAHVTTFHGRGGAVVLITHDMRLVAEYAGRVGVLVNGRIAFDGEPGLLFSRREVLRAAGLVAPPAARLAMRLWGAAGNQISTPAELVNAIAV